MDKHLDQLQVVSLHRPVKPSIFAFIKAEAELWVFEQLEEDRVKVDELHVSNELSVLVSHLYKVLLLNLFKKALLILILLEVFLCLLIASLKHDVYVHFIRSHVLLWGSLFDLMEDMLLVIFMVESVYHFLVLKEFLLCESERLDRLSSFGLHDLFLKINIEVIEKSLSLKVLFMWQLCMNGVQCGVVKTNKL